MKNTDVKDYFEAKPSESGRTYAIYMKGHDDPIEINRDSITKLILKDSFNVLVIIENIQDEETGKTSTYRAMVNCGEISHIVDEF